MGIAGWNVGRVMLEYLLLALIYRKYPDLAKKRIEMLENEEEEEEEMAEKRKVGPVREAMEGWGIYLNHPVMKAGLGLACLYMTVLGFDNITYGYCLMQGVPHAALGLLVGVSALVGVAGSLAYPVIRRRVGLERTGLLGMFLLVSTSSLAVLSAFLPGSPMHLNILLPDYRDNNTSLVEESVTSQPSLTWTLDNAMTPNFWVSYSSVLIFLTGIILARFGLWVVDLTVSQLLQEKVDESVRGVVNGVQESLNNSLDLAKCVLVILLPAKETFALLIFASFISISLGWLMYALYSRSERGHLFHFRRLAASIACLPEQGDKVPKEVGNKAERERMVRDMEEKIYV